MKELIVPATVPTKRMVTEESMDVGMNNSTHITVLRLGWHGLQPLFSLNCFSCHIVDTKLRGNFHKNSLSVQSSSKIMSAATSGQCNRLIYGAL